MVPEPSNCEHSFLPPLDSDFDIAIALNMRPAALTSCDFSGDTGGAHIMQTLVRLVQCALDKSLCRAKRRASSNVMIFLQENI